MRDARAYLARTQGLLPVLMISVAVVLLGTLTGSVLDGVHKIDAVELDAAEATAQIGPDGTQVLHFADWGLQLTVPHTSQLSSLRYTKNTGDSIGLSSTDLEKLGPACLASRGGLGTLLRFKAGEYATSTHGDPTNHFVATIGKHDYAYQSPLNACADAASASDMINRETSVIFASLDGLTIPASN